MIANQRQDMGQPGHDVPILIVMYERNLATVAEKICEMEGYPVETAHNGEDALRALVAAERGHIVLVDTWYAILEGATELAGYLEDRTRRAPHRLVVMSAITNIEWQRRTMQADTMVVLPFSVAELIETIERVKRAMSAAPEAPPEFTIDV